MLKPWCFASSLAFIGVAVTLPYWIGAMRSLDAGQVVRAEGPQSHLAKAKTPTMGGVVLASWLLIGLACFAPWHLPTALLAGTILYFAGLGAVDDWAKTKYQSSRGLSARAKLIAQIIGAAGLAYGLGQTGITTTLHLGAWQQSLGLAWYPWAVLVIVASSNAVNLTDGLDGLAILPVISVALLLITLLATGVPVVWSQPLVLCLATLIATGLSFLWFNCYPAQIFMGDTGSLMLGALLAVIALVGHVEWVLCVAGCVFVLEAISVIIQVASFKVTGQRVFKMAPLHHHFELKGWSEPTVIVRAWLLTWVACLCVYGLLA